MKTALKFTLALLVTVYASTATFANNFEVNKKESKVNWLAKKVTGQHNGLISLKTGSLEVKNNQITGGTFEMDMNSMVCLDITDAGMNGKLIGHLKSDDFFSVDKFSASKLVLTSVKKLNVTEFQFDGNLTIKGITQPVTFKANTNVSGKTLKATGQLVVNRAKFDIKYGSGSFFQGLGDKMIYDDFTLDFTLVANSK